jgi:peptide chain release factor 1
VDLEVDKEGEKVDADLQRERDRDLNDIQERLAKNHEFAMAIPGKVNAAKAKRRAELEADRRSQVGTGERSEKIRTYNYPQNRVTDHRIGHSIYNLPAVMDGGIDEFIEELSTRDEAERLATSGVEE